jgi:hypothetical protein
MGAKRMISPATISKAILSIPSNSQAACGKAYKQPMRGVGSEGGQDGVKRRYASIKTSYRAVDSSTKRPACKFGFA